MSKIHDDDDASAKWQRARQKREKKTEINKNDSSSRTYEYYGYDVWTYGFLSSLLGELSIQNRKIS